MENPSEFRAPRSPAIVNGAIAVAMLLIISVFAYSVEQAPPPPVAEFQPATRAPIKEAPPSLAGVTGSGPGFAAPSPTPAGATPTPPPIQVPRILNCVGAQGFQRQTEDPQSPPCVPYFDPTTQDNGGATYQGVTRDSIYVAFPTVGGFIERPQDTQLLAQYFNSRFEFYGRKLVLMPFAPSGSGNANPSFMQSDADKVANELNPDKGGIFASISYFPEHGAEHYYYDALAQQGILSINSTPTATEESHYQQYAPYEWSYNPAYDLVERNFGQMICNTLNGFAPQYNGQAPAGHLAWPAKRVFGIAWTRGDDGSTPDLAPLINTLSACHAPTPVVQQFDGSASQATNLLSQMQQQNPPVTSIACVCGNGAAMFALMKSATQQAYFPEWLTSPFGFGDVDTFGMNAPSEHQQHIIGIGDANKWLPPEETPWYQAIKEISPSYQYGDNGLDIYDYYRYEELMVLASGIQLAGPRLTPATFQQGLFRARFPDPGHGAPPLYQALVGFNNGGHEFFQDYAPIYYSPSAQNYTTNEPRTGSFCYVDHGVRYGLDQWPARQFAFYTGTCR